MSDFKPPLRIFCLEDNPLLVFQLEAVIEDLGHVFAGSLSSFADLKTLFPKLQMDVALVDIDLDDGPIGPEAAEWLRACGIPSIFVTGQDQSAFNLEASAGIISKPISTRDLAARLDQLRSRKG